MKLTLPANSAVRKGYPMFSGVLRYAPAALAGMARHSQKGNDKHNPGEPLHHARAKSNDHPDCIMRHLTDLADMIARVDRRGDNKQPVSREDLEQLLDEANALVWRTCIWSQELHEKYGNAPLAPGAKE